MYIGYDIKNGAEYAKLVISKREGATITKKYTNLGRVLDKSNGIYRNRERGVFTYDLKSDTYGTPPSSFVPDDMRTYKRSLILDFGDAFLLDNFLHDSGMVSAINAIGYGNPDTLYAMLCYYILCGAANCHANDWWKGSYAQVLYPKANLSSQRISDFLAAIGNEDSQRGFFREYLYRLSKSHGSDVNILIDSTGLPNSIRFPLTAISNHGGDISNEVRLIYVTQQESGLPIYFRYCPGNVIDTSTLVRTIKELKAIGINAKFAILDAGYYDDENIAALYEGKVSFVTRLRENRKLYKELLNKHATAMENKENLISYNGRYAYIKCVPCKLAGKHDAYAYIGIDIDRKGLESKRLFARATNEAIADDEVFEKMVRQGIFILVSSRRIAKDKILPTYYTRQQIEQVFDIGKNYADMLPLRIQNENTFRGHLLLTFMATVVIKKIQDKLKDTPYNPISLFLNMRNQKCKIYDDRIITQESFKKANDCYKIFQIKCPVEIAR
jgi:hypothetical protein